MIDGSATAQARMFLMPLPSTTSRAYTEKVWHATVQLMQRTFMTLRQLRFGEKRLAAFGSVACALMLVCAPAEATNESQATALALLYWPGAREVSLGGAGVASARGPVATYYNPALLPWETSNGEATYLCALSATYYRILQSFGLNDMYYMYFPTMFTVADWGQFGLSVTYLSLGEQTRTDESGNILGTFHTYTLALGLSYAAKISKRISVGVTAKWFYDHLADQGAGFEKGSPAGKGYALDAGFIYRMSERLVFGMALRNYGPNVSYTDATYASPLPINFNVGGYAKVLDTKHLGFAVVADGYKPLVQDYRKAWYLAPIRGWYDEDVYKVEEVDHDNDPYTPEEKVYYRNTLREEGRQVDLHLGAEGSLQNIPSLLGLDSEFTMDLLVRVGRYYDWDGERREWSFGLGARAGVGGLLGTMDAVYRRQGYPSGNTVFMSLGIAYYLPPFVSPR